MRRTWMMAAERRESRAPGQRPSAVWVARPWGGGYSPGPVRAVLIACLLVLTPLAAAARSAVVAVVMDTSPGAAAFKVPRRTSTFLTSFGNTAGAQDLVGVWRIGGEDAVSALSLFEVGDPAGDRKRVQGETERAKKGGKRTDTDLIEALDMGPTGHVVAMRMNDPFRSGVAVIVVIATGPFPVLGPELIASLKSGGIGLHLVALGDADPAAILPAIKETGGMLYRAATPDLLEAALGRVALNVEKLRAGQGITVDPADSGAAAEAPAAVPQPAAPEPAPADPAAAAKAAAAAALAAAQAGQADAAKAAQAALAAQAGQTDAAIKAAQAAAAAAAAANPAVAAAQAAQAAQAAAGGNAEAAKALAAAQAAQAAALAGNPAAAQALAAAQAAQAAALAGNPAAAQALAASQAAQAAAAVSPEAAKALEAAKAAQAAALAAAGNPAAAEAIAAAQKAALAADPAAAQAAAAAAQAAALAAAGNPAAAQAVEAAQKAAAAEAARALEAAKAAGALDKPGDGKDDPEESEAADPEAIKAELEAMEAEQEARRKEKEAADPPAPVVVAPSRPWWIWVATGVGGLVSVLLVVMFVKRRRSAADDDAPAASGGKFNAGNYFASGTALDDGGAPAEAPKGKRSEPLRDAPAGREAPEPARRAAPPRAEPPRDAGGHDSGAVAVARFTALGPGPDKFEFRAGQGILTIGRKSSNDVVIVHQGVSGFHSEIRWTNGQLMVVDKGSTNGTFVNNRRVRESPLAAGDILRFDAIGYRVSGDTTSLDKAGEPEDAGLDKTRMFQGRARDYE